MKPHGELICMSCAACLFMRPLAVRAMHVLYALWITSSPFNTEHVTCSDHKCMALSSIWMLKQSAYSTVTIAY